jgi:hypothetical protein
MEYFFRGIGGGLGDFLCNYASMKTLSLDHNREFYLYGWNGFIDWNHNTNPYIKRDTTGWTELFKEGFRFVEAIKPEHENYLVVELPYEPLEKMSFDNGPVHIGGVPFSNGYFEHRLKEIKDSLNLPNVLNFKFESDDVVLNTRRGEYPGASIEFIDLCFTDYYLKALQELNPKRIFLVSDDLRWTWEWFNQTLKPHFPGIEVNVFQDKPIIQFELMMKAPNLIICQSQFSRWSGILNNNNVFSPYKWYTNLDTHVNSNNLKHWNTIRYER